MQNACERRQFFGGGNNQKTDKPTYGTTNLQDEKGNERGNEREREGVGCREQRENGMQVIRKLTYLEIRGVNQLLREVSDLDVNEKNM